MYTTITNIENYLLTDITTAFEPNVIKWIEQISRYIETETGRRFITDTIASDRRYDGNGKQDLFIDETIEVVSVKISGILTTDFILYPVNELPKTRIHLNTEIFTKGEQNIEVNARWGYSITVPRDIEFAATVMVAGIINFSGLMSGEVKSEKLGDYSVTYKDGTSLQDFERAKEIVQKYKKISF